MSLQCDVKRVLTWTASVIVSMSVITAAVTWAADTRYVKVSVMQAAIEKSASKSRRDYLEDRIFELGQIPESAMTDGQRAMLGRFLRQINELNAELSRTPTP